MTKELFSEEDKVEIRALYNKRAPIIAQYELYEDLKKKFLDSKARYKQLLMGEQKIETSIKLSNKRIRMEMYDGQTCLTSMVQSWNKEMDIYLLKYNYEKLNDFLLIQPEYMKIGLNRVTSEFAREIKKEAILQNIILLQGSMRYGYGKVQTTNHYPTQWLLKNYITIYERTDKINFDV